MQLVEQIRGGGIEGAYFMSPLYPYLIAAVATLTGEPELWVRILQALFGGATTYLVFRIGKERFSPTVGFLASAIVALYAPFIYYDGLLLTESLQTLLITGHLLFLLRAVDSGETRSWIVGGVLLGLAVVTRATVIVFLPVFVVVWIFLRKETRPSPRHIAVFAAAVLLTLVPTAMHNAAEEGVFIPVTSSFGFNLYAGNNPSATGLYSMTEDVDLTADPNGRHWVEAQTGRPMDASKVSAFWRDRAIAWAGQNPGDATMLFLRKILLFFHHGEIDQLGLSLAFYTGEYGPVIGIPAQAFPVILLFAGIGLVLALRERRGNWILPVFLLVYVLSTSLFFVSGRLRLPIMPLLILYAAHAVVTVVQRSREGKGAALRVPVLVGALTVAALFILQPYVRQGFEQEHLRLGQAAFNRSDFSEAEKRFRASLGEQETVDGLVNLGNALAAQQRPDEAAEQYRTAILRDSTYALAWFNFGNLRMQTGSPQYAYGYWKKAIDCDPRLADARRNLGLLLMQAGRLDEAEVQLEAYLRLESRPDRRAEIARDLEQLRRMRQTALSK